MQAFLGHRTPQMTMHYTQVSGKKLEALRVRVKGQGQHAMVVHTRGATSPVRGRRETLSRLLRADAGMARLRSL